MVFYKYSKFFEENQDKAFDAIYEPGETAPYSGIYRCADCGVEVVSQIDSPLPPLSRKHHNHGNIRWSLVVVAKHGS